MELHRQQPQRSGYRRWLNQEDLSIYSADQHDPAKGADSGGRAVKGFCRPYARRIQGEPVSMRFECESAEFELQFDADPSIPAPTEIFIPQIHYPAGAKISADGCLIEQKGALAYITASRQARCIVTVSSKGVEP